MSVPRITGADARRLLVAILCLIIASCSGGGCSSGCSQCGTTPIPGGFPKPQTIANAASVRVTRPGLDFVQENLSGVALKALGTSAPGGVASFPIPKSTQSFATICPPATPGPAQCKAEIDLGKAKLRVNAITPNRVKLDGLLPVRIRDLPVSALFINAYVVAGDKSLAPGGDLCAVPRGSDTMPYKEFPLNVELPLVAETRIPRNGYTKVDVDNAVIDIAIAQSDVDICAGGGLVQAIVDAIKGFVFNTLVDGVKGQIKTALAGAFCTKPSPTVTPPCPTGSQPDDGDLTKATKCVFDNTNECVPALLGTDGHMDLSKALMSYSPGSQGGLDFVLASAGEMDPAPGAAGPASPWATPRKPPVPAEDNNANGISLTMLGGALPQPPSKCVTIANTPLPQNIPIPKELQGDTITPWPAGTPGPHVGFALAGRFLDHALVSAYNSGVLCLGISTDQVEQLQVGYLSILAPSLKTLTLGQGPGAAAITTRPGKPPKAKLGGGTNVDTDPLLTITLEQLAIDFYVWHLDRFARAFTYTADVTVPLLLETGKDPKTNPNGGILPKIGKIGLANGVLSNAELLLDEPAAVAGGVTGLVGGIVGQFLGGGLSPIDLSSSLASFGLGMDIPAGGIRKLTSGTDDFIGVFANLKAVASTASEEADTRATLIEKVVHPEAMSLTTATRDRFPTLRIHAEGVASKPTEQTWWIDDGPHSPWTRETDIVVDQDAMLLQGRHVLHVSSRIVGDMASEDGTPVEIPFVIDTLAPFVSAERDGARVTVRASDYVTKAEALVARRRVGGPGGEAGAWSDWAPLATVSAFDAAAGREVAIEVKDEEGNVGRVSLPLIRGKADSSLAAAGGACGCSTVGVTTAPGTTSAALAGLSLALAAALARRRRRR